MYKYLENASLVLLFSILPGDPKIPQKFLVAGKTMGPCFPLQSPIILSPSYASQ